MRLDIQGLSKSFGEKAVLTDFSFSAEAGKLTLVTGPSGCGKTTLLRLLCGLTPADSGKLPKIRCSYCFQENRLLPALTASENLRFVLRGHRSEEELNSILEELLPPDALTLPASQLSGGMQRRVAVARAMLADSDCVLLDEPVTGLDEDSAAKTAAFIVKYLNRRPCLITTHHSEVFLPYGPDLVKFPHQTETG